MPLPHGTKRDLLALVKKLVALERAADGAATETENGGASVDINSARLGLCHT
ncbi:hypothetical protein [Mesorhizobium sp. WSM2561]|uniref:hypothetical protein n=1 Tax=Mesorhizobium sp. WSM2561 TaxID=1040985 RepID=UPI0004B26253|nr:hypothetical protein [Mesorhizobium sp. WSM2561]